MTRALPAQLPDCFRWVEDEGGRQRLLLENVEVLEVRQQRNGWVVEIHLKQDRTLPAQIVAVRSPAAGVRWGARWSKLRAPQLAAMVAIGRRYAPRAAGALGATDEPAENRFVREPMPPTESPDRRPARERRRS